ncbi:MAG: 1-(5-phosphoribosyl)-5-[(5-phosphoribosylamino)methylideneamino]imidazole-4-carboxamide isomerase [Nitrospirota bacterium]
MIIFPAVDLKGGQCVRLRQGEMTAADVYEKDPVAAARRWVDAGAEWLHVVDLDGAVGGAPANREAIEAIVRSVDAHIQIGGGIRTLEQVARYLDGGAERVVLSTAALQQPEILQRAIARFPGRIVVSLDARGTELYVGGWTQPTGRRVDEAARWLAGVGIAQLILTDIQRDGMLGGVDRAHLRELTDSLPLPVIIAGGVTSLDDLAALRACPRVNGAIIGKALYTGAIDLKSALQAAGA